MIDPNTPFDEYAAIPAVSITRLKELARSPLHYQHRLTVPKESGAMTLGTAAHMATLEPERFTSAVAVWTARTESGSMSPRRGKAWDAFCAEHDGKLLLTEDEFVEASHIADAVRNDAVAIRYLRSGAAEVSMRWDHRDRPCKGRADWITTIDGKPVIVGLKTARDCRPFQFGAAAARLGYALQWAFYQDGYAAITGQRARMVEIVVESEAPHAVVVYQIPDDVLEYGRDEYRRLISILDECEQAKSWPGPCETEQVLTLPSWVYGSEDDLSELGLEAA
jgi:exodeoxyribonuclease VIII